MIPEGCILIDIDDEPTGERIFAGLKRMNLNFSAIKTPHGYQFLFADTDRVKTQKAGTITTGGFLVDYRLAGKGYLVLPTERTEGRHVIKEASNFSPMPALFLPVRQYNKAKDEDNLISPIIEAGQRNDVLFRHACRLKSWNISHGLGLSEEERREIVQAVNVIFCEPSLSTHEIKQITKSAEQYEDTDTQQKKIVVLTKFIPRKFTTELLKEHSFRWEGTRGVLWHYEKEEGIWENRGEDTVRYHLRMKFDALEDALKKRTFVEEILADVMQCCYSPDGLPEPSPNLIPCRNGVYDLDKGQLISYSPDHFFTWRLPWNYNPDAKADFLCKLIDDTLPDGSITLYELLAYCLYRGYPVQRFWILVGPGRNGKGVTMSIYTRLLGLENISNVTLDDIQGNRFAAADLHRKLCNISGEVSYSDLENTRLLKALTGGDMIQADRKYLSPVRFINHAKLIFATNSVPVSRDTTDAFYRRAHVIEFPRQFDINPEIDIRLREESPYMTRQYEGLLTITIGHLQGLRARGFRFTYEPTIEDSKATYQRLSNPLARFIQENCEKTYEFGDFIYKYEFHDKLNEWLRIHGFMTMTPEKAGKGVKDLGIEQGRRSSPGGDKQYYAYCGIKWAEISGVVGISRYSQTITNEDKDIVVKYPTNPTNPTLEQECGYCMLTPGQRQTCKVVVPCPQNGGSPHE